MQLCNRSIPYRKYFINIHHMYMSTDIGVSATCRIHAMILGSRFPHIGSFLLYYFSFSCQVLCNKFFHLLFNNFCAPLSRDLSQMHTCCLCVASCSSSNLIQELNYVILCSHIKHMMKKCVHICMFNLYTHVFFFPQS